MGTTWRNGREGQTLIALVLTIVIIAILAMTLVGKRGKEGREDSVAQRVQQQAVGVDCRNNLSQIRQAIQMRSSETENQRPASMDELREIPSEMRKCPVSGKPYVYDPTTGTVRCETPGHERY